ncbi:DHA2 family efflux MFS transporter permease subunit [Pedomonas mirosovicensis]|uniref:DHA2 family efflux MFS transporter permease subunit n=1 Tax=Pedomonas mirosovicensis TaxID=2908641 RepID=UPI002167A741|nr:DHA2 family efflux MFS transporter permease subunit [Pedomonas mirosovicensis]MCH8684636.1 DHA2 family efflux MFS transporter permease subunit [Pedomonas mirosovicensis]
MSEATPAAATAGPGAAPAEEKWYPGYDGPLWPPARLLVGFFLMVFGMFMAVLDIQIVAASIGDIQAGLAASPDEASWVQGSYLIAEIIMIPLSGYLSRALSTRVMFSLAATGFTLASILCATATTMEEMIIYRALQGFLGGGMIPSIYSSMMMVFGRTRQKSMMVAVSLVVTMAPTIGPTLGGWISDAFGWHWLFLVNVIPGIIVATGVWLCVEGLDKPDYSLLKRIDVAGLALMAVFLGCLEYVLEEGAKDQWFEDSHIFWLSVISTVAGVGFIVRTLTVKEPIVNLRIFGNYNFTMGSILGALVGIGLFGLVYIFPLFLGRVAGLSSMQIGGILSVSGMAMIAGAPLTGFLQKHLDLRAISAIGVLMLAYATWMTHTLTAEWRFHELVIPQLLRGFGLIMCLSAVSSVSFGTLPLDKIKDAGGLYTLCRNLGGAFGLAFINTVLQWRENFHWSRLGEQVSRGRPEVDAWLSGAEQRMMDAGLADPSGAAIKQLGLLFQREVTVMSYADCLALLGAMFFAVVIIPLLLKSGRNAPAGDAH